MPAGAPLEWRRRLALQAKPAFGCCGAMVAWGTSLCAKRKIKSTMVLKIALKAVMSIFELYIFHGNLACFQQDRNDIRAGLGTSNRLTSPFCNILLSDQVGTTAKCHVQLI